MSQWYYSDHERNRHGPVSAADLAELHGHGQLDPETLVWREGLDQWQPWRTLVGEVVPGAGRPAVGSVGFATASGDTPAGVNADPYAVAEPRSPYAPPRAPLLRDAGVQLGGEVVYAGFWKRVAAYLIDMVLLSVIGGVVGAVIGAAIGITGSVGGAPDGGDALAMQAVIQLVGLLIGACYCGWFYASHAQATPGKMAIGIKVVRGSGERIGFWRGFARYFAQIPSALILCIGYFMAGFTERKQALHDMICDTLVVDKWAYTEHPDSQRHELGTLTVVVLVLGGLLLLGFFALIGLAIALAAG